MTDTDRREPCGNCPFRRSAPLAHWCPDHYVMLAEIQRREGNPTTSSLFLCHKDKDKPAGQRGLCVGWMLDQRRRNVPSLALRMACITSKGDALATQLAEITGTADCYEDVDELIRLNLARDIELHPYRYGFTPTTTNEYDDREKDHR